ncbi:unnamed protein product [Ilex paraguariensis]|uniref:ELM2 domain-containing protein n=1 Tax=Ilex paraguariensis TaxID=185542 RepID=A0ABC8T4T0_9AQUA
MQKSKPVNIQIFKKPVSINWLEFITEDSVKLAIPVGPRFQADVPNWNGHVGDSELETSRWLGTRIWPVRGSCPETNCNAIGRGRPDFCSCITPGSIECVRRHVIDKRSELEYDLGTVFWKWKFDMMGESVSKLWNLDEQKKFALLVKTNPISQGKTFLNPALECFLSHFRESIVSYYFNVYIPRRIAVQTRSGFTEVDTDEDEPSETSYSKGCRKRCLADSVAPRSSEYVKTRYLTRRR